MNDKQYNDTKKFTWEAFIEEASKEEPYENINLDSKICNGLSLGDRLVGQYAKFWNIYQPSWGFSS